MTFREYVAHIRARLSDAVGLLAAKSWLSEPANAHRVAASFGSLTVSLDAFSDVLVTDCRRSVGQ